MPQCCAVPFCTQAKGGHKFPSNKSRRKQWLIAIRRKNYVPSKHARVCKNHFLPDDYTLPKESVLEFPSKYLKKEAVPSRFAWNCQILNVMTKNRTLIDGFLQPVNTSQNQDMEETEKTNETQPQEQVEVECRACLQKFEYNAGLLDIFQPWDPPWDGMGDSIAQDMAQITNVDITPTDEFSKLICQFCYQKLLDACSFIMNVRINDRLLRQRLETLHDQDTIWPKPIQVNRNINSDVLDVPIKQEVLSDDETYANGADDDFKEGVAGLDGTYSNLEIKIEPEEIMQPPPIQITVNGTITQDQFEQNSIVMNGDHKPPELEPEPEPEPEPTLEPEKVEIKVEPKSEEDEVENPPDLSLECILCTKSFNSVTGLKAHVIAQHSYKTVKRKLDGQPSPERKRAKHVCVTCRRSFTTPTDLMVHETCHNKLSCYGCNHKCDTFEQLTKHRKKCKALKNNTHKRPKTLDDVKRPHIEPPLLVEAFSRPVDLPETQKDSNVKMLLKIQSLCEEMDADAPVDQIDNDINEDEVKP